MAEQPDGAAQVATDLLAFARSHLGQPALSYAGPPRRLAGGRDTEVHAFRFSGTEGDLARPLVLRLFPHAGDGVAERRVRFEAAVHRALTAQGYPVPHVLLEGASDRIAGRRFLVMELVEGTSMADAVLGRHGPRMGALLAEAHVALHDLDARPALDIMRQAVPDLVTGGEDGAHAGLALWTERLQERGLTELDAAWRWLEANRPDVPRLAICHGDLHPLNVLVADGRVTGVIDWADVRSGDPAYDVARTSIVMRYAPLRAAAPMRWVIGAVRLALQRQYLRSYLRERPIPPQRLAYYEVLNATTMLAQAALSWLEDRDYMTDYTWRDPDAAQHLVRLIAARTDGRAIVRAAGAADPGTGEVPI